VAWLRLAVDARAGQVALLPWVDGSLSAVTVNRKLSALASFYEFHQRHGVDVAEMLTRWRPGGRGGSSPGSPGSRSGSGATRGLPGMPPAGPRRSARPGCI
jgi:hypothetical protein